MTLAPTVTVTAPAAAELSDGFGGSIGGGAIAGIVVGIVGGLAVGAALVWLFLRRWRNGLKLNDGQDESTATDVITRHEKDGEDIRELDTERVAREAGSKPIHEMQVQPSELEGDIVEEEVRSPVEMGMRSAAGSLGKATARQRPDEPD